MYIRKYKTTDRKAVEDIHFATGFVGNSMSEFLSNNHLWRNNLKYYLDKEPESIFILENNEKVVGYLLGCINYKKNNEIINFLLNNVKNLSKNFFLPQKDRIFWKSRFMVLINALRKESEELKFKVPKNAGHLHINLLPEARGKNWGTKLLKNFEQHAKQKNIGTIYAGSYQTRLNLNTNFWLKNGFKKFSKIQTSTWKKQLPNETIYLICYFKNIKNEPKTI